MTAWDIWCDAINRAVRCVDDAALAEAAALIISADITLVAGNGGSAALASHAAQAIGKPRYVAGGGRRAVCLTDNIPLLTAHTNDGGWESALVEIARPLERPVTTYLLISSSGNSKNLVRLAERARDMDQTVIALTGFDGGALRQLAHVSLHADSKVYEIVEPCHDFWIHRIQHHLAQI